MMNAIDRFVSQATSGRWLLTVTAGIAFFLFCLATSAVLWSMRGKLEAETVVALFSALLLVIQGCYKDYFSRTDRNGKHPDEPGVPEVESLPVPPEVKPEA